MVLSLALLLGGCALRTPVIKAPSPAPVVLAPVHDPLSSQEVRALPDEVVERLEAMLVGRDLRPRLLDDTVLQQFTRHRATPNRLAMLAGDDLVLLVEAEAEYVSQLNGRMRWAVDVTLSLAPPGEAPVTNTFQVTVFLLFIHQDADDAIIDAIPIIERHASQMLDEYFTSIQ